MRHQSERWLAGAAVIGALLGAFVTAVAYTAHYARATSYLSDDPSACVNCHIMNEQFDGWAKGPHHARATCNDCHVPHSSVLAKYLAKAEHGYRHSKGFTLQDFHEPIQITPTDRHIVVQNCVRCHAATTHEIRLVAFAPAGGLVDTTGGLDCVRCHAAVAHGPIH
ncbi:MAG: cytochrome c nitrite reductase small subunit [Deltaproteobacteria bacterium]|nr:cytochrome c nitrite reductase small subunit [Deltaproteobacteria bacterium]